MSAGQAAPAPPRALAFEVIRATFEDGAFTERAFREVADEHRLAGRERAQAQRLAYGAVQRRGTSDTAIGLLAERPLHRLDPPVLAGLRLGLYELLFADATPDHAAVDQAVELTKGAGAAHASGLVNAVLRRAARERDQLIAALLEDDSTPEAAAVAHSAPLWLARMWWEELGRDGARSLLAACNEPAEVAMRVNALRAGREAALAKLRGAGVEARPAAGPWPLAPAESVVLAGRTGGAVGELVAAGEAELGITAIATMMATRGVDIVGRIPAEIQSYVCFAGALGPQSRAPEGAKALLDFVTGPAALPVIRAKGMEAWADGTPAN